MSTWPSSATVLAKQASTCASSVTSTAMPMARSVAQLLGDLIGALLIVVGDHDLGTFADEEPGNLLADAASRAGHDGNLVLETHGTISDLLAVCR